MGALKIEVLREELVLRGESVLGECAEAVTMGACNAVVTEVTLVLGGAEVLETVAGGGAEVLETVVGSGDADNGLRLVGAVDSGKVVLSASEVIAFSVIMLSAKLVLLKVGRVAAGGKSCGEEAGLDNKPN